MIINEFPLFLYAVKILTPASWILIFSGGGFLLLLHIKLSIWVVDTRYLRMSEGNLLDEMD